MGKRKVGKDNLLVLAATAAKLQESLRGLGSFKSGNDEIEAAFDGVKLALNRVVVEILRQHLEEVEVRLDPKQPQAWGDFHAVLEVVVGAVVIHMPVPKLVAVDPELANQTKRRIRMNTRALLTGQDEEYRPAGYVPEAKSIKDAIEMLGLECVVRVGDGLSGLTTIDPKDGQLYQLRQSHFIGCGMMGNHSGSVQIALVSDQEFMEMYKHGLWVTVWNPVSPKDGGHWIYQSIILPPSKEYRDTGDAEGDWWKKEYQERGKGLVYSLTKPEWYREYEVWRDGEGGWVEYLKYCGTRMVPDRKYFENAWGPTHAWGIYFG